MKKNNILKDLTLIELLAVIVILAIIAAIAIPAIGSIINNQRDKAILSDISGLVSAAKLANADGQCTNDVCTYDKTTSTNNQVEFSSDKFTGGTVNFSGTNSSNPLIIITGYAATEPFKGKNKDDWNDDFLDANGFTESALNTAMGN
jgi:type II secretory pathway pseudopilin PulG